MFGNFGCDRQQTGSARSHRRSIIISRRNNLGQLLPGGLTAASSLVGASEPDLKVAEESQRPSKLLRNFVPFKYLEGGKSENGGYGSYGCFVVLLPYLFGKCPP